MKMYYFDQIFQCAARTVFEICCIPYATQSQPNTIVSSGELNHLFVLIMVNL